MLKLETHDEDTEFLIRKLGLTELMEPFTMWKHNSKGVNSIGDYDYYLYEEEWRNPRKMNKEQVQFLFSFDKKPSPTRLSTLTLHDSECSLILL